MAISLGAALRAIGKRPMQVPSTRISRSGVTQQRHRIATVRHHSEHSRHPLLRRRRSEHSYTYAKTGWTVLGQPGGVAYQIFDQKGKLLIQSLRPRRADEANTIAELASKLGIDPTVLQHTVDQYNMPLTR